MDIGSERIESLPAAKERPPLWKSPEISTITLKMRFNAVFQRQATILI
jgi:hypothetical protein